ncbi:Uncharacterised protein [Bordetella trematum]|nr:Uncharacterised protein [Bordetella trematum]VDH07513.1 Uncharacterised protein [Bordetella trematum]
MCSTTWSGSTTRRVGTRRWGTSVRSSSRKLERLRSVSRNRQQPTGIVVVSLALVHLVPLARQLPYDGTRERLVKQHEYLGNIEVAHFRDWLVQRLQGHSIGFVGYPGLLDARNAYCWPLRLTKGLPKEGHPYAYPTLADLPARSSLAVNHVSLVKLQHELRAAYEQPAGNPEAVQRLAGVVAAIFYWGGVFTTTRQGGNKPWLAQNAHQLRDLLRAVADDYARGEDRSRIVGLRFNSGMTKIYSLLLDDFVIYDSRVAAALAWLALRWWCTELQQPEQTLPELLRFGCLAGNGQPEINRRPSKVFPMLRNDPYGHYQWNVRTNWLLADAMQRARAEQIPFQTLRELEAALFQMGARVDY